MYKKRYLISQIEQDLNRKMVFLGGPRQVGKTTLAELLIQKLGGATLNWDIIEDKEKILSGHLPLQDFIVFDELHKFRKWRNYLKGLFDKYKNSKKILVTGSARLDYYRHSGDSLQGRYHYLRLHPLSVAELDIKSHAGFQELLIRGGFPEPYWSGDNDYSQRWSREYNLRLIHEDVNILENVRELSGMEELALLLPKLVGSPLSINSIAQNLEIAHKTANHWIEILERLYHIFRLKPFKAKKYRTVSLEQKHYHYNWANVKDEPARFENLVASHMLKYVHFLQDTKGENIELFYFRTDNKKEVDFVLTRDNEPYLALECKSSKKELSDSLVYFKARFPEVRAVQVVNSDFEPFQSLSGISVIPAYAFLAEFI